jgi:hypothetical protein
MTEERKYDFFRGEYFTIKEAERIVRKIERGKIQPTEAEILDYQQHKEEEIIKSKNLNEMIRHFSRDKNIQPFKEDITIQDYLIMNIEEKIGNARYVEKIGYCEEHGHKFDKKTEHISSGMEGTIVHGRCPRCNLGYERILTLEEMANFYRRMNTPFTI